MAKKKDTQEPVEGVLVAAAKKIGKVAGKLAAVTGAAGEEPSDDAPPAPKPQTKSVKVPKLEKKSKSRCPEGKEGAAEGRESEVGRRLVLF